MLFIMVMNLLSTGYQANVDTPTISDEGHLAVEQRQVEVGGNSTALWIRWPTAASWPGTLTIIEAAAFLRISTDMIRDMIAPGRDGRAILRHQRLRGKSNRFTVRISKDDLAALGRIDDRSTT